MIRWSAKLMKTNRSQNSCRISLSERKLTLALEDKTLQMLHESSSKAKTKSILSGDGNEELIFFSLLMFFVFIIILFCLLEFRVIFSHSVFLGFYGFFFGVVPWWIAVTCIIFKLWFEFNSLKPKHFQMMIFSMREVWNMQQHCTTDNNCMCVKKILITSFHITGGVKSAVMHVDIELLPLAGLGHFIWC